MKKLPLIFILVVVVVVAAFVAYCVFASGEKTTIVDTSVSAQAAQTQAHIESEHTAENTDADSEESHGYNEPQERESQVYIAGKHYVVIDKPVATVTGDKVEVRELFWYYCGHCYTLEPYLHKMKASMSDDAEFVIQPAVFSERWEKGAVFYYVLSHLGELNRLHGPLFNAIHRDGVKFNSQQDFINWLNINGVDMAKANDAFKQYSVAVNVNKAKADSFKYQIKGVPTLVVNGKYWVDAAHAGSIEAIFKVVDFLIEKEMK